MQEFMDEGYLILRQVIPLDMLEPLRHSAEEVVHRRWPEGISEDTFQPMIHGLERYIDADTANLVEFCLHENILETTRQLMGGVEVAPSAIFMMYNPVRDFGPWWWHRDVSPLGTKGPRYFYEGFTREIEFSKYLAAKSQALYERWVGMYEEECDTVEAVFRAIIEQDKAGFVQGLAQLHPGESMRFVCLIHLCRIAQQMEQGSEGEFSPRFTADQIQTLWQGFGPLDEALKTEEENYLPGLQIKAPSHYRLYDLPENFGIDEFVGGWATSTR